MFSIHVATKDTFLKIQIPCEGVANIYCPAMPTLLDYAEFIHSSCSSHDMLTCSKQGLRRNSDVNSDTTGLALDLNILRVTVMYSFTARNKLLSSVRSFLRLYVADYRWRKYSHSQSIVDFMTSS